ncbi:transcriptional regulator [Micromonospora profundi]|uniref:Transcriptional regulator n=1 Tax=Micromonospora profundi TaxID=1420889 RepID=A0AAJ6L4P6_9ACTN|nr:transcriptional regulator [Micromonospora profundi]WLS44818.1 transcriptional regulator [Micromonospora profundi]
MPQTRRGRDDKLAEYGARATVRIPSDSPRRARPSLGGAVRGVIGAGFFLVAVPVLLWTAGGDPLRRLPAWSQIPDWFARSSGRFTPDFLIGAALWAMWLLWGVFALLLLAEILAAVTRWRIPLLRLPAPLHRLVFGLAGTAALAVTSASSLDTAPHSDRPSTPAAATERADVPRQAAARGPAIIHVADQRYLYTVERHDTLSKVAKEWLGDAGRWPEVCRLNKHRHFPVGGVLRDCDLIYPGWELRLPTDARPPRAATPATPPTPRSGRPATPPASPSTAPDPPDPAVPPPAPPLSAGTPTTTPSAAPSGSVSSPAPSSGVSNPATSPPAMNSPTAATDDQGVDLSDSGWLPWSLAAAITAAAAMVWLQRRRRFTAEPDDDPPTELPPTVVQVRRAVAAHDPEPSDASSDDGQPLALVPDLGLLPGGGTGIVGDGARAAARAALVAVLASGDPHHPDARGEVVIDAATLATLLGPDAVTLNPWPRLHVTDSINDALTVIESQLLHRSRILDEHALTDLDELRRTAPDEEALPPVVLVTGTPPASAGMRAKVALALGEGLHVSALLLGEWAHGPTVEVTPDGHATLISGQSADPVPPRLPVLESVAALQILTTLREAQTGEPPASTSPAAPVTIVPLHAGRTETMATATDPATPTVVKPTAEGLSGRARLRVLGAPRIEGITAEGRPLRAKALELAVYLAVHPDGASTRDIGEYLEPDARISQADQRVHTNASNLRHVLSRAGTAATKNAYVIKSAGRYLLDPATVDVDVWTLRDLMRSATIATGPRRRELLTAACDLYTAPLADGQDYEWLQPHRETVRRWGTEAHLLLADDLLHRNPQAASDLLAKAIRLDRYNEALYAKAMHARHALGDADGIRTLLRALTKALADLDAEPHDDTIALATQLRNSPDEN